MRGYGAAVVHLSPHAHGEADVGVDNAAGIARLVAALVGLGHRRIAFLAGPTLAVRRAPAPGRLPRGVWRRPASRSTSGWS